MKFQIESVESGFESDDITISGTFVIHHTRLPFSTNFIITGKTANEILKNSYNVFAVIKLLREYYSNIPSWKHAAFDSLEEHAKKHLQDIVDNVLDDIHKIEDEQTYLQQKKDKLSHYLDDIKESLDTP